jgi:RNA polymerase sigma factor (sigma-70 family)
VNSFGSDHNIATQPDGQDTLRDAVLVAAARSGDSSALVTLTQRHARRVLHEIYRITNNWQDAEDVLQESLMRAFIHLDTFEFRASFSTWFTSIAINTALMLLRREKKFLGFEIEIAINDSPQTEEWEFRDHRDNPEQHYAREQGANLLRVAMLRLRPESRRVIELQQTGDLSIKEIAQSLGVSESAVKSRLLRARTLLRTLVRKESRRCHAFPEPARL